MLEAKDLPNMLYEEDAVFGSKNMAQHMEDIAGEQGLSEMTPKAMLAVMYRTNRTRVNLSVFYGIIDVAFRIAFSVLLKVLFDTV